MKNKLLTFCILLIAFASCKTVKEVPVQTKITTVEKLVPVYVPADSSYLSVLLGCDSLNNVYMKEIHELKTRSVQSNLALTGNELVYRTKTVRDTIYIKGKDVTIEKEIPVKVEVTKEVNKLTGWQWFQIYCGRMLLILAGVFTIILITKRKPA